MSRRRPPLGLMVPAAGAVAIVVLPVIGLLQRAPLRALVSQLTSGDVLTALRLSLECSFLALALSMVLGVPLAWMLARTTFPGRALLRALVTLPMVLPPVVGGVALLFAFGSHGFAGEALQHVGVTLPFTTAGAVLAETFVAMPFLVIATEAGLRQTDQRYEEAAATLGARPWMRFWRITLPLAAPSLAAGAALTWARALGEFGATITFAGNLPGSTQTMPLAVYVALEENPDGAIALSLLLLAVSLAILVVLRDRWLGAAR
jgi:molybdate transport system permease protein